MAYTDFYIQTTGDDMNAGSSTSNTASATSTNGAWSTVTNIFTAASGTPFAGVSVGDYASIYVDGATGGAVYVAQITAKTNTTITLSATVKMGSAPTTNATARTAKVNGAWGSMAIFTSLGTAATSGLGSMRINVKAGTYANTTTSRNFNLTATTTAPVWIRGYNTTPGDRDTTPTLTPPSITYTTGLQTVGGSFLHISHLYITGANTGRQVAISGNNLYFDRCQFENTNAAAASSASLYSGSLTSFSRCWFSSTSTATRSHQQSVSVSTPYHGCVFTGGGAGLEYTGSTSGTLVLSNCVFRACGGNGLLLSNGLGDLVAINCTFRGCGGDAIAITTSLLLGTIASCLFASNTGWGINNSSGANIDTVQRLGNDYWSNSSGTETGMGDAPSLNELSETADPHQSSTNMTLVGRASARFGGQPGLFENETYTTYPDVGAVQGSGVNPPVFHPGMAGGMEG